MKVLLVQSHLGRREGWPPVFPLGLCYLAAALPTHTVRILDLNLWSPAEADIRLRQELLRFAPDIVGLSIRNIDTTQWSDRFYYFKTVPLAVRLIRETAPGAKLVLGGPGFSMFAGSIMARVPEADIGVAFEGEETFPELLANLEHPEHVRGLYLRRAGEVYFTGNRPLPDFAALPFPRREMPVIDLAPYITGDGSNLGVQSKRGCVLTCAYCSYPFLSGSCLRLRDPRQVVDEIEYLQSLKVTRFSFVDNLFNIPPAHAQAICEELIRRRLKVVWSAWFEIGQTTQELVDLARKAGCAHIGFSPDAAFGAGLARLHKGITTKDIDRSIQVVRRSPGLRAGYNFFLLPDMSWAELWQTWRYFLKIPWLLRGRGRVFGLGWIRVEPDTEILRMATAEGVIRPDAELLPEDEVKLAGLFYRRGAGLGVALITAAFDLVEKRMIPAARRLLKKKKNQAA
ncbi:MAG: cobalamin-dependent protein [Kiritimatiellae bacterium]|nr:cobalamin-dependent protein [Kiritimatiellia bacterium]